MAALAFSSRSRAPPPPLLGWWFSRVLTAQQHHSVSESIVLYLLSAFSAVMSLLPSYSLLRLGDIAVTITYFSEASLHVSIANCMAWMVHDVTGGNKSSVVTLLAN